MTTLLLLGLLAGGLVSAAQETRPANTPTTQAAGEFKPGVLLVKFSSEMSASLAQSVMDQYGATYIRTLYGSAVQVWQVAEGQELALAAQLTADPLIEYAEPDHIYHTLEMPQDTAVTPNDPSYGNQWAHPKINSPAAWDVFTGSTSVTIAIIDTGVDESHPDLSAKLVTGYDAIDSDNNPHDGNGHGTHVAGIAAAITNNSVGVAGMDWNARIMAIRVLGDTGSGYSSDITEGINWAYQNGAKVLNLSLGGPSYDQTMQDAINAAHTAGSLVVAAMGNCRTGGTSACPVANPTNYPAAYSNVLAVAATNPNDAYTYYSQYGSHCDIAAPGGEMYAAQDPDGIYSTLPTYWVDLNNYGYLQNYDYLQGTSQATPHVAGLAALIFGLDPTLTPDEVQYIIETTAYDPTANDWTQDYGWGRINALAAVEAVSPAPSAPTLNAISNGDLNGDYTVSWTSVTDATSYTLQEANNASFSGATTAYSGSGTSHNVTGKAAGTWYYRVRASNANGDSDWSNTQSAGVAPSAPTLDPISNAGNSDEYTLSWSSPSGATGYTLQEADNASFTSPEIRYMGAATSYNVTGQHAGTWYYRVSAYNSVGSGPWSGNQSTTVDPLPLGEPTVSIDNTDGDDSYLVDWSDVVSATTYTLEESGNAYFDAPTVVYSGTLSEYNVTGQSGGTWYYRARGFGATGDVRGPWSATQSAEVNIETFLPLVLRNWPPVPDEPVLNAISNTDGDGNYTVSWSAASGATGYELQEATNADFTGAATAYSGSGTSTSISGKADGTYYYRVRASNAYGYSGWSNTESVVVAPASGPTPGFWESTTGDEFYVTTDRAYVDNFAIYISVLGCGDYKITRTTPTPISNNQFSFTGSFYASGTFNSTTTASGTDGLSDFYIPGCGNVSGGPWSWNATWQDSSQPTFLPAQVVEPNHVIPVLDTEGQYRVVVIER